MKNISNKAIGGIVVVLLLAFGGYLLYSGSSATSEDVGPLTTSDPISDESSPEVVQQLNRLRSININTDFLASTEFRSLADFSIQINPQPVGRDNPFAPASFVPSGDIITPTEEEFGATQPSTSTTNNQATSSSTSTPSGTSSSATTSTSQ